MRPEEWVTRDRAVGQKFGRLTIVAIEPPPPGTHHPTAVCTCECGGAKRARLSNVIQLRTQSCGCLSRRSPQ